MGDLDGADAEGDELDGTVPWRALRDEAATRLDAAGVPNAAQEARWIVEEASGYEGSEHHLRLDLPATQRGVAHFDAMLARREAGEPLAYVLGRWSFRTLDLAVDRRVLIPRPETEDVAGHALAELDRHGAAGSIVVDLGTGSGAIALAVAAERAAVEVWATDRSSDALVVARANLAGLGGWAAPRVRMVEGDWFDALPVDLAGRITVIVSNPPYVAPTDPLPPAVADWEPVDALIPGETGLEAIEHIIGRARHWLAPGGSLVIEIGETQGDAIRCLAETAGFTTVEIRPDLAGRDRALVARVG